MQQGQRTKAKAGRRDGTTGTLEDTDRHRRTPTDTVRRRGDHRIRKNISGNAEAQGTQRNAENKEDGTTEITEIHGKEHGHNVGIFLTNLCDPGVSVRLKQEEI